MCVCGGGGKRVWARGKERVREDIYRERERETEGETEERERKRRKDSKTA